MDSVSRKRRSEIMSRVRSKDTEPEMLVRRLVFAMGYRYRLHARELPGKPDLVFRRRRKIISCTGVFGTGTRAARLRGCRNRGRNSGFRSWRRIANATSETKMNSKRRDGTY